MELLAIITVLILIQTLFFGFEVGKARGKYKIKAPAVSGDEMFDRHYRIHQNTIEQIVIFIPSLWLFGYFVHMNIGAGLGLLFLIGRLIFRSAYLKDPASREIGFIMGFLPIAICLLATLFFVTKGMI
ncbi:MAG: MAPEG family protein [Gammaproteobacteria bacterium]|nr:MAG: MAPEG family protein [Gammaproteobacteria bacterium]|tara:strand:- start:2979 stop:3362 length:384 start_codon:yes stop_codon:yes gene_type:complete